jgi:mitochondrial import inner membrane translocase subunit TIM44
MFSEFKVTAVHCCTPLLIRHFTMLPRHVRRAVLSSSTPQRIRAALLNVHSRTTSAPSALLLQQRQNLLQTSSFHSSARRQDGAPKSPFQTFVDVLKEELRKNRELQDNVKQLQGDVDKLQDSEAMKRARAAYERARVSLHLYGLCFGCG